MPNLLVHEFIDEAFFGRSFKKLHRAMDKPVFYLGRTHRVLFHDPLSASFIAQKLYPNDEDAILAAHYHILFDEECSKDPEYKKYLENLAELWKKKKKKRKKKRNFEKKDPFVEYLKKLVKLKRLFSYLTSIL